MADVPGPVLITGGLGYVGGRVASYLNQSCPDLRIRLMTRQRRSSASWAGGFTIVEGDVLDPGSVAEAVRGVHTIVHMAASNEVECDRDPSRALDVTTKGTLAVLGAARDAGVARFLYMSTFRVYSAAPGDTVDENTPTNASHPYAITHLSAEQFADMYRQRGYLESVVLRLSNAYGAPMDRGVDRWMLVFNDLCRQAADTGTLVLTSSGQPQRDFISLKDVGRAVHHFLSMEHWADRHPVYNLGGECSMSILDLAQRIAGVYEAEYSRPLGIKTGGGDNPQSWLPVRFNIDKLKATGFRPDHNLDEEISRTLALCRPN